MNHFGGSRIVRPLRFILCLSFINFRKRRRVAEPNVFVDRGVVVLNHRLLHLNEVALLRRGDQVVVFQRDGVFMVDIIDGGDFLGNLGGVLLHLDILVAVDFLGNYSGGDLLHFDIIVDGYIFLCVRL